MVRYPHNGSYLIDQDTVVGGVVIISQPLEVPVKCRLEPSTRAKKMSVDNVDIVFTSKVYHDPITTEVEEGSYFSIMNKKYEVVQHFKYQTHNETWLI